MSEARCNSCGAGLIPGTGFCRQCGTPVIGSEDPTAILATNQNVTTQRLESQTTNPYQQTSPAAGFSDPLSASAPPEGKPRRALVLGILVLAIVTCVGLVSVVRSALFSRSSRHVGAPVSRALIYPGSRIMLDIGQEGGGSVLQLTTTDPLDKVREWYVATMKPNKILLATMNSAILRKDNVTVTLVGESNTTTVVIKQTE